MSEKKEFSLWLVPPEEVFDRFAKVIALLSKEFGAPLFEPHITLVGDLLETESIAIQKTQRLANQLAPIDVKLNSIDYLDHYFRCLYVQAEPTPSILEANLKARDLFGLNSSQPFMPHLSLLYGTFSSRLKERIRGRIDTDLNVRFQVNSVHLVRSSVYIEPANWQRFRQFAFLGGSKLTDPEKIDTGSK